MINISWDRLEIARSDADNLRKEVKKPILELGAFKIDSRLLKYYSSYFGTVKSSFVALNDNAESLDGFYEWLDAKIAEAKGIEEANENNIPKLNLIGTAVLIGGITAGDPSAINTNTINTSVDDSDLTTGDPNGINIDPVNTDTDDSDPTTGDPNGIITDPVDTDVEDNSETEEDPENTNTNAVNTNITDNKNKEENANKNDTKDTNKNVNNNNTNGGDANEVDNKGIDPGIVVPGLVGPGAAAIVPGLVDGNFTGENPNWNDLVDPLQQYVVDPGAFNALSPEDQDAIINKLREVGYSTEEIENIINGKTGIPAILVKELSKTLENALLDHPEIRQLIIDIYGFDIFNDDGSINYTKLAMLIFIDMKDPNDKYDLIKLLYERYGIELVPRDELLWLAEQLMRALQADPDLRRRLLELYGFDIFNPDGTINYYNLIIAMLMDKMDPNDEFNLMKHLVHFEFIAKEKGIPIGLLIGLGAAAIGTGVAVKKKKKKKKKNKNELEKY